MDEEKKAALGLRKGRNTFTVFKKRHEFSNGREEVGERSERSLSFVVFHHLHTGCRFQSPWRGEAGAPEQV